MARNTKAYLIASQSPQQELGLIAQLMQTGGFNRKTDGSRHQGSLEFVTPDSQNSTVIKFYQEIGALRLELNGPVSERIGQALAQYIPPLTAEQLAAYFAECNSDMERRMYTMLMVLTYPDAATAMADMRKTYFDEANDAVREGVIQGLAFMEVPDVGQALEDIERDYPGTPSAALARKALDGLSEQGIVRESVSSFRKKIVPMLGDGGNPTAALALIEKYEKVAPSAEIRDLHARALRLLGRADEASALLVTISASDPDAAGAYCERALISEAAGMTESAADDAARALAVDPLCAQAEEIRRRLSLASSQDESIATKIARLSDAIAETPDDTGLLCQRGSLLLQTGDLDDALDDLKAAYKSAPNDPRLPLLLARAYDAIGYFGSALQWASLAVKQHAPSQEPEAFVFKTHVYLNMCLFNKASESMNNVPANMRDDPRVMLLNGIIHEINGDDPSDIYANIQNINDVFASHAPKLYRDFPILRSYLNAESIDISEKPQSALGREPSDPFFKRCEHCGSLTMKRRTFCKECGGADFI